MTKEEFLGRYFTFLLSGKAEDLSQVSAAYGELMKSGVPMDVIQDAMDEAHRNAEILCLALGEKNDA